MINTSIFIVKLQFFVIKLCDKFTTCRNKNCVIYTNTLIFD